jgi:hypothetical protein
MANVQKKSSLCNEKNQCTCKSFDELQKINLIIAEMEKTTVGKIPSTTGETSDKIRMLHGFIKKMINAAAILADEVKTLQKDKKKLKKDKMWWIDLCEFWREECKIRGSHINLLRTQLGLPIPAKTDDANHAEENILHMSVDKTR